VLAGLWGSAGRGPFGRRVPVRPAATRAGARGCWGSSGAGGRLQHRV